MIIHKAVYHVSKASHRLFFIYIDECAANAMVQGDRFTDRELSQCPHSHNVTKTQCIDFRYSCGIFEFNEAQISLSLDY